MNSVATSWFRQVWRETVVGDLLERTLVVRCPGRLRQQVLVSMSARERLMVVCPSYE